MIHAISGYFFDIWMSIYLIYGNGIGMIFGRGLLGISSAIDSGERYPEMFRSLEWHSGDVFRHRLSRLKTLRLTVQAPAAEPQCLDIFSIPSLCRTFESDDQTLRCLGLPDRLFSWFDLRTLDSRSSRANGQESGTENPGLFFLD